MSGGFGGENGGFSESAASLTFHDPDDDNEVGIDTQADDFRFNFTLPSQDFQNYGASSLSFDDDRLEDNIKMVKFGFGKKNSGNYQVCLHIYVAKLLLLSQFDEQFGTFFPVKEFHNFSRQIEVVKSKVGNTVTFSRILFTKENSQFEVVNIAKTIAFSRIVSTFFSG